LTPNGHWQLRVGGVIAAILDWRRCEAGGLSKFPVPWDVNPWIFGDSSICLSRSS
jgi:hypothetical protein